MNTFAADYLANLTADLTSQLLNAAGRRLRQSLQGTEGEQALGRAVQAGVVALLAMASATQSEEIDLMEDIFTDFFADSDVVLELSMLLRGTPLDTETLSELFAEAGFDAETLPGLDFEQGVAAFEAAFLLSATAEPTLQDTIATGQLLAQTSLQSQMLATLRDMVGLLQKTGGQSISVQRGEVIAQGDSVAGGRASINVGGSIYGGITVVHQHIEPDKPDLTRAYCEALRQRCNVLPIAALGGEEGADDEITLDQVYIALDTKTTVPLEKDEKGRPDVLSEGMGREERPLSALEAATRSPHLALLGDPGSGKSTFVRQLASRLATTYLAGGAMRAGWEPGLMPVLVTLRELAARLARLELKGLSHDETDRQFVEAVWEQWRHDLKYETRVDGFAEDLEKALRQGDVVLIFDGLDEVSLALRQRVRRALTALQHHYPQVQRQIVTCRVRSYTGSAVLPGFDAHTLAPFDEGKIRDFVTAWYTAQARLGRVKLDQVDQRIEDLQAAALSEDLREMASNPMLLTTMAIIHQRDIGLPKERVRLYDEAVKVLIGRWQKHKGIAPPKVLVPVLSDDLKLRQILERIAFEAHQAQSKEGPDARLSRIELLTLLEKRQYLGDMSCAVAFLDYVDQRAGLLVGYGGDEESEHPLTYDFAHRSFQEYLAGRYMVGQGQPAHFYWQRVAEGDFWYQAAMYGAEDLLFNRQLPHALLNLAYRLCPAAELEQEGDWRASVWSGQMAALLDVETVRADDQDKDGGARYVERLLSRLQDVLKQGRLSPIEHAEAGKALARLGDPRPGVGLRNGLPHILWSEPIEPGPFTMGNTKETDEMAYGDEAPQFECNLIKRPYQISRYPITVVQYQSFIEAGGYKQRRYWTEAGWKWKKREDVKEPRDFGEPFNLPNHPQVGVSWYEAVAFCNWLSEKTGQDIHLPTEAQWERAARHTDARRYPWGEDHPRERCNMADIGISGTCAVGIFPQGDAICGAADMSGNVLEWCSTKWRNNYQNYEQEVDDTLGDDYIRVVRGGSFLSVGWLVRCAIRYGWDPYLRYRYLGFRVVFSPSTTGH